MTLLQRLVVRFTPTVTIRCDPQAFIFQGPGGTESLRTFLYFEQLEHSVKIVAVGIEIPVYSEGVFRADMLAPNSNIRVPNWLTINELLDRFVQHGTWL
jgi:hypothetical protein